MISLRHLTKQYGTTTAVNDLSLDIAAGKVTGFLGPNGAGKSTTMRMIMGLDRPTSGEARINGKHYAELPYPLREVGALLDARAVHPRRSAHAHLLSLARSNGIPRGRVDQVLDEVGLTAVAGRHAGTFSLGMGQRLGIAAALLGDPHTVIFDEPVNGLDPDGVRWVRSLARSLAAEGRTVFVSSHLMSEMQLTADHLVIIGRGELIADAAVDEVIERSSTRCVVVRSPEPSALASLRDRLADSGFRADADGDGLRVLDASPEQVGDLAHELGVRLHELRDETPSLEEAYLRLSSSSVEYSGAVPADQSREGA
ncbi:ABC transporter ATP-binding protein [Saccharopolyspora hirsuta]|uniref:ABC transporter ATP-binding protein n=1 Tax=Saccharopolyspora hirsuta TaxID=1837 RepID=A0A5M7BMT2_SACHI|nr:ABC transporter ATP-binding protein [Saccharopolyspora hirsuta]KAA5830623.1 ABC transporter ATP-binding protein [Saccharopolyspora hirsuta]